MPPVHSVLVQSNPYSHVTATPGTCTALQWAPASPPKALHHQEIHGLETLAMAAAAAAILNLGILATRGTHSLATRALEFVLGKSNCGRDAAWLL